MSVEAINSVTKTFPIQPTSPSRRKKSKKSVRPGEFEKALETAFLQKIEDEKFEAYVHGLTNSLESVEANETDAEAEIAPQFTREEFISNQIEKNRVQFLRLENMLAWQKVHGTGRV